MKIAILNAHGPATGVGKCVYKAMDYFLEGGMDVTLFDLSYKGSGGYGHHIKRIKPFRLPVLRQCLNDLFYYPLHIPKGFDVYHISAQGGGAYLKYIGKNTVITVHDMIPVLKKNSMPGIINWISKRCITYAKKAGIIISDSEHTKRDIQNYFGIGDENIRIIPPAVDHDIFKPIGKRKYGATEKIILHVGSEDDRKNVHLLIKAFHILLQYMPNVRLYRIGKKSRKIARLINRLGINDKVLYFSDVSEEKLAGFYNNADVFVFPSSYEGFGIPPLEAMACGCPVLSSSVTSLSEVVGDAAIKLKSLTAEEICNGLILILSDTKLARKLSSKGLAHAKKFSWQNYARDLAKAYSDVFSRASR